MRARHRLNKCKEVDEAWIGDNIRREARALVARTLCKRIECCKLLSFILTTLCVDANLRERRLEIGHKIQPAEQDAKRRDTQKCRNDEYETRFFCKVSHGVFL
jgi:hypothetical protein